MKRSKWMMAAAAALTVACAGQMSLASLIPGAFVFAQPDSSGGSIFGSFIYDASTNRVTSLVLEEGVNPVSGGESGQNLGSTSDLKSLSTIQYPGFDGSSLTGNFDLSGTAVVGTFSVTGSFGSGAANLVTFSATGYGTTFTVTDSGPVLYSLGSLDYPKVPEPASFALLASTGAGLVLRRRR